MKNSLSSKKIVLSLIAISFLNSYAIASYSGNTYINSEEDGTETISPGNDGLVFITRDGSVTANSRAIYFNSGDSDTFLFLNNGTIQGSNSKPSVEIGVNNSNGADIKFFFNGGNIGNNVSKYGVVVWGNNPSDRSNIEHFTNVGTISSNNGEAIYLGNADIGDFTNWGTITSNKKGMNIFGNIGYLTNIGTLTSDEEGIDLNSQGTIENLINFGLIETTNSANSPISIENEGIIHNLVNMGMIKADAGTAITIHNPSDMTNFINMGTIRGNNNKVINIRDAAIKNFVNAGTIDNDIDNDNTSIVGINIQGGTIKNFVNAGTIAASTGINLTGATIENFINKNIIEAKENGIIIGENAQINNIILENDSIIESGNDAIYLSNSSDMGFSDSIKVKNGAKIKGGNAAIHIDPQATVKTITIAGEVFGGTAGIVNEGNIGTSLEEELEEDGDNSTNNGNPKTRTRRSAIVVTGTGSVESSSGGSGILNTGDGSIDGDIEIKKGANLGSIVNTSTSSTGISGSILASSDTALKITNAQGATLGGGVVNNGNADVSISNQGFIGLNEEGFTLSNNGKGSIDITDWIIYTDSSTNKLQTIRVGGSNANAVMVENLTVDQSNLNVEALSDINNLITGVNQANIKNIQTNGGGEINLSYDPLTGKLSTDFNLNASIAGANFRALSSSNIKRTSFIDGVMNTTMQSFSLDKGQKQALESKGTLYADASTYIQSDIQSLNKDSNSKEHALLILPYFSSLNVELSLNEQSKGHTKGTLLAYSTLKESGVYGVYAGYEDANMESTYFDVKNRSYYAGLRYFNTLFTTAKHQEVYLKAQSKAAYTKNDMLKKIGENKASANPNSYSYGASLDLGMNFILGSHIFTPEIGLGYEGGFMEAYSIKDIQGRASVQGGERIYKSNFNLLSTKASFTWFEDWLPHLKTSLELGAKFYANPSIASKARFGSVKVEDEFELARIQRYLSTALILPLNPSFHMSINYNTISSKEGTSHTAFAQFNYLW